MPDEYRVTIRLDPSLYAQLEACGCHGQPMAAIIRQALVEYLARQPQDLSSAVNLAGTVAAMAASLAALRTQVEDLTARVDILAATRQPIRQSDPTSSLTEDCPPFDTTKNRLGRLCPRGHEWGTTGQSLLRLSNQSCRACENQLRRERRAAQRPATRD